MSNIKYEPVFGDQSLFDGAGTFTGLDVVIHSIASGIKSYARSSDLTPESLRNYPVCAMRRIITVPTWTKEDQKAGKLPEVGYYIQYGEVFVEFLGLNLNKRWVIRRGDGVIVDVESSQCEPIETPEERAIREENYWVDAAYGNTSVYEGVTEQEDVRLKNQIRAVYRAMLSGELPLPKGLTK